MIRLEVAEKVSALVGVPLTVIGLVFGYVSLSLQIEEVKDARSIEVALQYLTSEVLAGAKTTINERTANGSDYSSMKTDKELRRAVELVLNYLETISMGVRNNIYNEKTVCSHLRRVVEKQVVVHIRGQSPDGVSHRNERPYSENDFKSLVHVYGRWKDGGICVM